ncbi:hypothetical protein B0T24DRAFT_388191 [Lasiosphaeria ovina]|uniref:Uncharacterized protein n=1 Tax=Lasiosphaeria ovina TaxID=92902 RepID=A0AAE0K0C5_9PEZI|nr:hypothetical protein B0T24DRAFT_388191 [Lasiosphaeria ovina]
MPLFSRHPDEPVQEPIPEPVSVEERPKRHHGLFGSRRSPSPTPTHTTTGSRESGLNRHSTDASHTSSGHRSLLQRTFGNGSMGEMDPSIVQARERVMSAETAERDADRALLAARESVRQAREHVRRLELEAEEEARLAKIKQYHAREVSKRGKQLGRHDV